MGSGLNFEIRGCFKMAAAEKGIPYVEVSPGEWKKALCGHVNPTKEEKRKYGKAKARKKMTVASLEALGFTFPKKVVNPKTGKSILIKLDVTDSLGILWWYLTSNQMPYTIHPDLFKQEPSIDE
jgi:hypothetical protein